MQRTGSRGDWISPDRQRICLLYDTFFADF